MSGRRAARLLGSLDRRVRVIAHVVDLEISGGPLKCLFKTRAMSFAACSSAASQTKCSAALMTCHDGTSLKPRRERSVRNRRYGFLELILDSAT